MKQPNEHISDSQLDKAYWLVTHRDDIKKAFIFILFIVNVVIWGYLIYLVVFNFIIWQKDHESLMNDFATDYLNTYDYKLKDKSQPLQIQGISVIEAGEEKYDLLAKVTNPNPQWLAHVDYQFSVSGIKTKTYSTKILPNFTKVLLDLGVESKKRLVNARFTLLNVRFEKELGVDELTEKVVNFEITKQRYTPGSKIKISDAVPINRFTFTVANNSSYNFWKVPAVIVLYSGTRPVGVNEIVIEDFASGEVRDMESNWFNKLPKVNDTEVFIQLDVLDEENYKGFRVDPELNIRDYIEQKKFDEIL